jgi:hypothetical protein
MTFITQHNLFEIHPSFYISIIHFLRILQSNIPQCECTTVYSPVKENLRNQFGAILNETTIDVCTSFLKTEIFLPLGEVPSSAVAGLCGELMFSF